MNKKTAEKSLKKIAFEKKSEKKIEKKMGFEKKVDFLKKKEVLEKSGLRPGCAGGGCCLSYNLGAAKMVGTDFQQVVENKKGAKKNDPSQVGCNAGCYLRTPALLVYPCFSKAAIHTNLRSARPVPHGCNLKCPRTPKPSVLTTMVFHRESTMVTGTLEVFMILPEFLGLLFDLPGSKKSVSMSPKRMKVKILAIRLNASFWV